MAIWILVIQAKRLSEDFFRPYCFLFRSIFGSLCLSLFLSSVNLSFVCRRESKNKINLCVFVCVMINGYEYLTRKKNHPSTITSFHSVRYSSRVFSRFCIFYTPLRTWICVDI